MEDARHLNSKALGRELLRNMEVITLEVCEHLEKELRQLVKNDLLSVF